MKTFSTKEQHGVDQAGSSSRDMILHIFGEKKSGSCLGAASARGVFLMQVAQRMSKKLTGYVLCLVFSVYRCVCMPLTFL